MGRTSDWLREERRRTLGDWVALCPECGHVQRYFEALEDEVATVCPTCRAQLVSRCTACGARIASAFAVECESCGAPLRQGTRFGVRIRRER